MSPRLCRLSSSGYCLSRAKATDGIGAYIKVRHPACQILPNRTVQLGKPRKREGEPRESEEAIRFEAGINVSGTSNHPPVLLHIFCPMLQASYFPPYLKQSCICQDIDLGSRRGAVIQIPIHTIPGCFVRLPTSSSPSLLPFRFAIRFWHG